MFQIAHPVDVKTGNPASLQEEKKKKRPFVGEGSNYSRGMDEGKKLPPAIGTEVDRQEQKQQHSEAGAERDDLSVGGGEGDKMLSPARKKARTEDKGEETDEEFSSPFGSYLCQSPARSSPRVIDEDDIIDDDEDPPDELLDDVPQYYRKHLGLQNYPGKTVFDLCLEHKKYVDALCADEEGTRKLIEEATKNFEQDAKAPKYYYYYGGPLEIATPDSIMCKAPSSK